MTFSSSLHQPVGPKAGTPGTSAPSQGDSGATSGATPPPPMSQWVMLAPMLVVVVVMLFTSRTQRKREAETRAKLKKGDKVVTSSGLIGELVEFDDKVAKVKVAPGTNVQMLLTAVSPYDTAPAGAAAASTDKTLKDLKDAKAATEKKG